MPKKDKIMQPIRFFYSSLISCAICCAPVTGNAANITVFNNDAVGWASVVGTFQTEDFSSSTLVSGLSLSHSGGVISGGVFSDQIFQPFPGFPGTTWSFSSSTTAFGGNWDLSPSGPGGGIAFTVTFSDNTTQLVSVEVPATFTGEFFGFVSDTPFSSVMETSGTQNGGGAKETYNLDNLTFQTSSTTPLPGALPLFASGLGALGLIGWRRKRKLAA